MKWGSLIFPGLDAPLSALKDTMLPSISPELVADAAIQVSGGYDQGLFGVSIFEQAYSSYWVNSLAYKSKQSCAAVLQLISSLNLS